MTDASTSASHTVVTGRARTGGAGRPAPDRSLYEVTGRVALAVVVAAWGVVILLMMSRRVFISHDSLSNNVHVWYLADQIWSGHGIPLHMPVLASGKALTFPYGSVPWISAALVWPLLGDRAVTLWLVLGFVGTAAATLWTFPSLRRGWWAAATLTNPALVISPVLGQLPFLWAMAAFTLAMGMWRRGRTAAAVVLATLASIIHPAVLMPIIVVVIVLWLPFEARERRWPLVGWWLLTVVLSLPAVWAVFQSPIISQSSMSTKIDAELQTVGMRLLVVLVPMVFLAVQHLRWVPRWTPAVLTVLFVALQFPMYRPFGMNFAWGSLLRNPDAHIDAFADSDGVTPGQTYRVLSGNDGKYGLYAVVQAGGVLDAEFFPEGLHRGPFHSTRVYAAFLRARQIDSVVVFPSYTERYTRSNEPKLLAEMAQEGCVGGLTVVQRPGGNDWKVYDVDRGC